MLLCVDRVRYVWSESIRGLSVGCVCVLVGFPLQGLSNMSNCLFVAVSM
jgi:hypothetical protein